jgi:putative FmdB family regulatory protein
LDAARYHLGAGGNQPIIAEVDRIRRRMPLYEYQCKKCKHIFEKIQSFSDKPIRKCPKCSGPVEKLLSAPAVQFKGTGWYVTDYAKSGAKSSGESKETSSSSDGGGSEAKPETKAEAKSEKPEKKSHKKK